jgi:uncharacterized protein YkwD
MALRANSPWLARLLGLVLVVALALAVSASSPTPASAGSPCTKFGDERTKQLKDRQARASVRCFLNRKRRQQGLPRLDNSKRLQKASQKHTEIMVKKNCFSHQCPGEGSLTARLLNVEYLLGALLRWTCGENIAYGDEHLGSPKAIVKAWMKSAPHRANILSSQFRDVGVGVVAGIPGSPKADGGTYTTVFGMRQKG